MKHTPSPTPTERFKADLLALLPEPGRPIALAVSGGPDSVALLLLAHVAFPGAIEAMTVDHGLRPESGGEAAQVAAICAGMGVPHHILPVTVAREGEGVQAAARAARYDAMAARCRAIGAHALLTAHHADDQAETLMLRLARGAGIGGLRGIRPIGDWNGIAILRPLLGWRRSELAAIVSAAGIAAADDPSNRDPHYDRTAARALLKDVPWLDPDRLAASARHLADAEAALDWTAREAARGRLTREKDAVLLDAADLPHELVRRLVLIGLAELGVPAPEGPSIERLIAALSAGRTATLGGIRASPGRFWHFSPAPARRSR